MANHGSAALGGGGERGVILAVLKGPFHHVTPLSFLSNSKGKKLP